MLLVARSAAGQSTTWPMLEARRAVITGVDIVVTDVFDVSRPADDHWFGRAANALHVQTRPAVIARELLFAVGDVVDASRVLETERNLRQYPFVRESQIVPVEMPDGSVRARVEVLDAWSLNAGGTFSRVGGRTEWSGRLDEVNVLGRGKRLAAGYAQDIQRTSRQIDYIDPQVLGSRWQMALGYGDLSDGRTRVVRIARPFYALDTAYALGMDVRASDFTITEYDAGASIYTIAARTAATRWFASRALRIGDHTVLRTGVAFSASRRDYGAPAVLGETRVPAPDVTGRRLRGFSMTNALVQDRPATFQNLASIGHTEDFNLGWTVNTEVGRHAFALGSGAAGPFVGVAFRKGWRIGQAGAWYLEAAHGARRDDGVWRDALTSAEATVYGRAGPWQTLVLHVDGASALRPDPGRWIYLGGGDGMRGYVDHLFVGDRRVVATVEDRIVTSWRPLGLVQAGFVIYGDVGVIRRLDTGEWSRVYADVGAGLRFGVLKSARANVAQISMAFPVVRDPGLSRWQLVLGNVVRF